MPTIKFGEQEIDLDTLSKEARERFEMLVATDKRLRDLQLEVAMLQTARHAYISAIKELLPSNTQVPVLPAGDTLRFP